MDKNEYIEIFNAIVNETPISFTDKILPLISEYLTDINYKNSNELIYLISQNPQLSKKCIPTIVDYYTRKLDILSVVDRNTHQIIKYYG